MTGFVAPVLNVRAFTCSFCGVLAQQLWHDVYWQPGGGGQPTGLRRCFCTNCRQESFWSEREKTQVYPRATGAVMPHPDLPEECRADFMEARNVASDSPRAAAALLRLCVQRLLAQIGGKGKSIDDDIGALIAKGLPVQVKEALDICRVVGNNAVHPGELDVKDDPALVSELFVLINFIVAQTIERDKSIAALMAKLPSGAKEAIEKRDAKVAAKSGISGEA